MKDEKETKSRLLASAKQEFMEKGYSKASLRTICKNAGMTTGALYFFFKDKEDLFAYFVEEPLQHLMQVLTSHYEQEVTMINHGRIMETNHKEDMDATEAIAHYMYQYYDEFQLLLLKSQGSRFESCVDEFVAITDRHYRIYSDYISSQRGVERVPDNLIHWFSHIQVETFIYMLTHEPNEERAEECLKKITKCFLYGWTGLYEQPEKQVN